MANENYNYYSAAIHEAAHAVVAVHEGWDIGPEGIEIIDREYTSLSAPEYDLDRTAQIDLAGRLAELKEAEREMIYMDREELRRIYEEMEDMGEIPDEEEYEGSDLLNILKNCNPVDSKLSVSACVKRFLNSEQMAIEILNKDGVWRAIKALADEVHKNGKVSQERAKEIIGEYDLYS